jgi:hypothetical protein
MEGIYIIYCSNSLLRYPDLAQRFYPPIDSHGKVDPPLGIAEAAENRQF